MFLALLGGSEDALWTAGSSLIKFAGNSFRLEVESLASSFVECFRG